jgi:hypothetical protein
MRSAVSQIFPLPLSEIKLLPGALGHSGGFFWPVRPGRFSLVFFYRLVITGFSKGVKSSTRLSRYNEQAEITIAEYNAI